MVKILKLPAVDYTLKLEVDRRTRRARVYFDDCRNKTSTNLGEEILWKLCTRFVSALEKDWSEDTPTADHNGLARYWITTLTVVHTIILCTYPDDNCITIHCKRDAGEFYPDLCLNQQTADEWKSMLKKYVKK